MPSVYVFEASTEVVLVVRGRYDGRPGRLRADIEVPRRGDGPRGVGAGLADAQPSWALLGEAGASDRGLWTSADEEGGIPAEAMGAAAREELFSIPSVAGVD